LPSSDKPATALRAQHDGKGDFYEQANSRHDLYRRQEFSGGRRTCQSARHSLIISIKLWFHAQADRLAGLIGGPAWIRTKDQGIHVTEAFPPRVDYLFTLGS